MEFVVHCALESNRKKNKLKERKRNPCVFVETTLFGLSWVRCFCAFHVEAIWWVVIKPYVEGVRYLNKNETHRTAMRNANPPLRSNYQNRLLKTRLRVRWLQAVREITMIRDTIISDYTTIKRNLNQNKPTSWSRQRQHRHGKPHHWFYNDDDDDDSDHDHWKMISRNHLWHERMAATAVVASMA